MEKISKVKVQELLKTSAQAIRTLSEENKELQSKVAQYETGDKITKIASMMVDRGMAMDALSAAESVRSSLDAGTPLATIETAVSLRAKTSPFGEVSFEKEASAPGTDPLTAFLVTG